MITRTTTKKWNNRVISMTYVVAQLTSFAKLECKMPLGSVAWEDLCWEPKTI